MGLIVCEGLDRTGKTTVSAYFESLGYEIIHMSAPDKKHNESSFMKEMVDLVSSAANKDIFLDRSYYGEACVWPEIYNRKSLLSLDSLEYLREIEDSVGVKRIWMTDPLVETHWKRCVENNEPITKIQFVKARSLFSNMAHKHGFETVSLPLFLKEYPDAKDLIITKKDKDIIALEETFNVDEVVADSVNTTDMGAAYIKYPAKTNEQLKLEKANAINDVLARKILKQKGLVYDELDSEIRSFLNSKLSQLMGTNLSNELSLTKEEIVFYKTMYARAINK